MNYPLAHVAYEQAEIDAVVACLDAGRTTCGPRVRDFEHAFADTLGSQHAVMVNSGSSADLLVAFGLGQARADQNEILVPAVTWPTQVWSCLMAGYKVRLVDVDPTTFQFNQADLASKLTFRTKALFPAHILGNVGNMDVLVDMASQHSLSLIEDCCEALGAHWRGQSVGTFGKSSAFSFFFSHLISTMEGGMVLTDTLADDRMYRLWRAHGWEPQEDYRFWFTTWGFNLRPTELQGAFGCVQLAKLEQFKRARTYNYDRLVSTTCGAWDQVLAGIKVLPECDPSWHGFPLMVNADATFSRTELCRYLDQHGIENRPIVAGNLARQPAIQADDRIICGPLPGADAIHQRGFYIGLASFNDDQGTTHVAEVIDQFLHTK